MNEETVTTTATGILDLGYEVLIVPVLWAVLLLAVAVLFITSIKRTVVSTDENGFEHKKFTFNSARGKLAGIILIAGGLLLSSLVWTPPGHRAAIYSASGGVLSAERNEGVSFVIPILQNANMMDVRVQKYQNTAVYAQTTDLLEVTMQITVNYRVAPEFAAEVFQTVGQDYQRILIEPAVLDEAKIVAGQYRALDIPKSRAEMGAQIHELVSDHVNANLKTEGLDSRAISITSVALEDTIFADDYVKSVLNEEVAEREANTQENLVRAEEAKRQQRVIGAEAKSEELRLEGAGKAHAAQEVIDVLGGSVTSYLEWLRLQQWNGQVPQVTTSGSGTIFDLSSVLNATPDVQPEEEEEPAPTTTIPTPGG